MHQLNLNRASMAASLGLIGIATTVLAQADARPDASLATPPAVQSLTPSPGSIPLPTTPIPSIDGYVSPLPATSESAAGLDLANQFSAAGAAASTPTREAAATSRLAQAPEMFGDSMSLVGIIFSVDQIGENDDFAVETLDARFPVGSFGLKVSDNNSPLPRDRVYYRFSHYQNLIDVPVGVAGDVTNQRFPKQISLPVHTLGIEKTFCDGQCSIEVRAPFAERIVASDQYATDNGSFFPQASIATAGEGNVSAIAKCIIGSNEDLLWSGGLGVETPTGRDTRLSFEFADIEYQNQAVYLYPYLAALWTPQPDSFHQAFIGVNVPTNKDELVVYQPFALEETVLTREGVQRPVLISVDFSSGYWLLRRRQWRQWRLTDMAAIGEIHYTGSLGSGEVNGIDVDSASNILVNSVADGSVDTVNLTGGLHLQFGPSVSLRVSGVIPVADRLFDNEITAQCTYWY